MVVFAQTVGLKSQTPYKFSVAHMISVRCYYFLLLGKIKRVVQLYLHTSIQHEARTLLFSLLAVSILAISRVLSDRQCIDTIMI